MGALVMIAGALLLAFNAGLLPMMYKSIVFSWPSLLIAGGICCLCCRGKRLAGLIMLLLGGFFLLPRLEIDRLYFITQNGWAIALILGGILIIGKTIFGRQRSCSEDFRTEFRKEMEYESRKHQGKYKDMPGYVDRTNIFSGGREYCNSKEFKGGEINSIFGGLELDLSDAQLAEGTHTLEINAVFGGCVLYIPLSWNVRIMPTSVFGQFADNRPKMGFEVDEKRMLIIKSNAVFGGGEIKCR